MDKFTQVFSGKFLVEFQNSDDYFEISFIEKSKFGESEFTPDELAEWLQDDVSKALDESVIVTPTDEPVSSGLQYHLYGFEEYYAGRWGRHEYSEPPAGGGEWEWLIDDEGTLGEAFWKEFLKPFTEGETKSAGIYNEPEYQEYLKQEEYQNRAIKEHEQ